MKIFERLIIVVNIHQWAPLLKIEHDKNLTDELFLTRKFLDLQYIHVHGSTELPWNSILCMWKLMDSEETFTCKYVEIYGATCNPYIEQGVMTCDGTLV